MEQYVCTVCGYNMVGYHPGTCPFCGASQDHFLSAEECSEKYRLTKHQITPKVLALNSYPKLGLEHTAYRIEIEEGKFIWIDCPSTFRSESRNMTHILFTHHHFLGASNLYRNHFSAKVWIHEKDSRTALASHHSFDNKFEANFTLKGIEAYHVDGHTEGFTLYIYEDCLFICDYTLLNGNDLKFNPYGPRERTIKASFDIRKIVKNRSLKYVCGVDYVLEFEEWYHAFTELLIK